MHSFELDDYPEMAGWFRDRGMPMPADRELPDEGVIAPGLAAGFLVQTDTGTAFLDMFISNPNASATSRDKAIMEITQELIGRAKVLGFSRVMCSSQLDTIVRRARALGFTDLGDFRVFSKEI